MVSKLDAFHVGKHPKAWRIQASFTLISVAMHKISQWLMIIPMVTVFGLACLKLDIGL
jgi:hypothetical protein